MPFDPNLFAIIGTDEGRVKEAALKLTRRLSPPGDEFGLEIVNGQADNSEHASRIVSETIQAIQTLPFFGGEKVVWLQGASFFGDSITGKSQTTIDAVERLQELIEAGVPPDVKFVISASEMNKVRRFYKRLSKLTKIEVYDLVDTTRDGWETQVMGSVAKRARELDLRFGPEALERFVLSVGADTRQLDSELEKLSLFVGRDREVTVEDVRGIVAATHAGAIFAIGDALASRNLPLTWELIEQQLRRGESAIAILLAAIVPRVRNLLQTRDLLERHRLNPRQQYRAFEAALNRLPEAETAHLPRKKDGGINCYGIHLTAQHCGKFSLEELKESLHACLDANLRLVSTQTDHRVILSQLVTRILARSGNRRAA